MRLPTLLDITEASPVVQRYLALAADDARTARVSGLAGSSRSLLLAHAHRKRGGATLVIVEDTDAAEEMYEDVSSLLDPDDVALFPPWEVLPYDQVSPPGDLSGRRLGALHALMNNRPLFVVATVRAVMQRTMPPSVLAGAVLQVAAGATVPLNELTARCNRLGYERTDMVQAPGHFSVRGGIVDVYPHGMEQPCRIEFFGDEVESIRLFDIYTQRSSRNIDEMTVLPNREMIDDPETRDDVIQRVVRAGASVSVDASELVAHIEDGGLFEGSERYLPYFHPSAATIMNYLPDRTLIVRCEPDELAREAESFEAEYEDTHLRRTEADDLVPGPEEAILRWAGVMEESVYYGTMDMVRGTRAAEGWLAVGSEASGVYQGAMDVLKSRLKEWKADNARVVVVCDNEGQAERLREILGPDAPEIDMAVGPMHAGFILPDLPLVVLTDAEIFNRYRRRRRKVFKEGVVIEDFTSLKEGDFVVHIDHGIGRYVGLKRITVDERERDCLTLIYAGDDRVFIPIEQLHRVQKYVGSDGEAPALSKLGGKAWEQAKKRTRKAVRVIAEDLVKLYAARQASPGFAFSADTPWQREMEDSFIYEDTPDQEQASSEVKSDMEKAVPMDRLICGDVGYGKTEVAIRAAFKAVLDGKQVAVLAPTTILAQQHLTTFTERLADYPVNIRMLSRFVPPKEQKAVVAGLREGDVDIVIGTHRLISGDIDFSDMGLLVVDEEQRFGVVHKERLKQLKTSVDVMTMTATPIPRTLHMSLVSARDMSLITTPPRDRLPVHTEVVRFNEEVICEAIMREVDRGGQVFFVHNRVQSIEAVAEFLRRLLPQVSFVVGHGQMQERELEQVMIDFLDRKYDCLVSTMIIESGLDIPSVNTILVNRADRFGLAQLYQLRGRVGRSNHRAYAYLMIPAAGTVTPDARKRLAVIAEYTALGSGFHIAMRDLEIRGAGNLLGTEQHGFISSIGFDLYCRLLKEAMQDLKGETREEAPEAEVELQVGAFIPDDYIADRKLKVGFYQRLSRVEDEQEVASLREEMQDRFGRLPDPVRVLFDLVSIRQIAARIGLLQLRVRGSEMTVAYRDGLYPSRDRIARVTDDPALDIEFPHGDGFRIRAGLTGKTEAERVDLAKNLLLKLL
ncbi:MAG: transcription-repair coupling factor [Gemmatimonadetes bacterium]|nr:transcription-repair coupling factor [Gemmatimonadota bacterium]MYD26355.1 transcription-repair coupling factor [Gemmatimonadota bacterium]MYI98754.1 transcription-repair coupling factor [Gemmatimonadota bacterium]